MDLADGQAHGLKSIVPRLADTPGMGFSNSAGVADYWVVNLIEEVLEVYREPVLAPSAFEWKYDSVRLLRRNAIITPLGAPRARIRVAALLP